MSEYQAAEPIERHGYTGTLYYEIDPSPPSDWCNVGTLVYETRNAKVGELSRYWQDYGMLACVPGGCGGCDATGKDLETGETCDVCNGTGWREGVVALPVRAFDGYGGTELSIADSWDDANGYIVSDGTCSCGCGASHRDMSREDIERSLRSELGEWQQWAQGDVYGYDIVNANGESVDSCWGFYGHDYAMQEMTSAFDSWVSVQDKHPGLVGSIVC